MSLNVTSALCWIHRGYLAKEPRSYFDHSEHIMDCQSINSNQSTGTLSDSDSNNYPFDTTDGTQLFQASARARNQIRENEYSDSSEEANQVLSSDFPLVTASMNDEQPMMELMIFDPNTGAFYTHDDIIIPSPPLALCWLEPSTASVSDNCLVALGSLESHITVWDFNITDCLIPTQILGKPKKSHGNNEDNYQLKHNDGVISLAQSKQSRNILASGSCDHSIILWDLETSLGIHRMSHHTDKVQALAWTHDGNRLLSAGYDQKASVWDIRQKCCVQEFHCTAEPEALCWNPHNTNQFRISQEDGVVLLFDNRMIASDNGPITNRALFQWKAHKGPTTVLLCPPSYNGMIITASTNGKMKIWQQDESNEPKLVFSRKLKAGPIVCGAVAPDADYMIAFGGSLPVVYDLRSTSVIASAFGITGGEDLDDASEDSIASDGDN